MVALRQIDPVWEEYQRFRPLFAEALDPDFYPLEWLDGEVWSGRIMLFSAPDCAILVALKPYPSGLVELHGMLAAGNLQSIVSVLIPQAIAFGKANGCRVATIESRSGWAKVMRNHGWELHQVTLRKSI